MPQEQEQKRPSARAVARAMTALTPMPGRPRRPRKAAELKDEMDDILDEIDSVLEENAEEFVKSYVQKGGE